MNWIKNNPIAFSIILILTIIIIYGIYRLVKYNDCKKTTDYKAGKISFNFAFNPTFPVIEPITTK